MDKFVYQMIRNATYIHIYTFSESDMFLLSKCMNLDNMVGIYGISCYLQLTDKVFCMPFKLSDNSSCML